MIKIAKPFVNLVLIKPWYTKNKITQIFSCMKLLGWTWIEKNSLNCWIRLFWVDLACIRISFNFNCLLYSLMKIAKWPNLHEGCYIATILIQNSPMWPESRTSEELDGIPPEFYFWNYEVREGGVGGVMDFTKYLQHGPPMTSWLIHTHFGRSIPF